MVNARSSRRRMNKMRKTRSNLKKTYRNLSRRSNRHVSRKHQTRRYRGGMDSTLPTEKGHTVNPDEEAVIPKDGKRWMTGVTDPNTYLNLLLKTPQFMNIVKRKYDRNFKKRLSYQEIKTTSVAVHSYKVYRDQPVEVRVSRFTEYSKPSRLRFMKKSLLDWEQKTPQQRLARIFKDVDNFGDFGSWKLAKFGEASSLLHIDRTHTMLFMPDQTREETREYRILFHMAPVTGFTGKGQGCAVAAYLCKKDMLYFETGSNTFMLVQHVTPPPAAEAEAIHFIPEGRAKVHITQTAAVQPELVDLHKWRSDLIQITRQVSTDLVDSKLDAIYPPTNMKESAESWWQYTQACFCPTLHLIFGKGLAQIVGGAVVGIPRVVLIGVGGIFALLGTSCVVGGPLALNWLYDHAKNTADGAKSTAMKAADGAKRTAKTAAFYTAKTAKSTIESASRLGLSRVNILLLAQLIKRGILKSNYEDQPEGMPTLDDIKADLHRMLTETGVEATWLKSGESQTQGLTAKDGVYS